MFQLSGYRRRPSENRKQAIPLTTETIIFVGSRMMVLVAEGKCNTSFVRWGLSG